MEEEEYELKFEDCASCKWRCKPWLFCEDACDVGESYEEDDYDEVDKYFRGRE